MRWYLFRTAGDPLHLKQAHFYSTSHQDDYWYFFYRWRYPRWGIQDPGDVHATDLFYDHWGASLQPDPMLGYVRKASVAIPGHETSNLATRGTHDYETNGPKIVFYGDSWVESNAFSADTLTAKMEKLSGMDCLNYGVGGYGLDQIYLLFERTFQQFDLSQTVYLMGVIGDDFGRMLLRVRTAPKPYFVMKDHELILYADHIDAYNLERFFDNHAPDFRIFVYELFLAKTGVGPRLRHHRFVAQTERCKVLAHELVRKCKEKNVRLGFVIFDSWANGFLESELTKAGIPFLTLQPDPEHSELSMPDGHPNPRQNDIYAERILDFVREQWGS